MVPVEGQVFDGVQGAGFSRLLNLGTFMKIYTASYWEPDFHGPGRKIGISPSKPNNLMDECGYECDLCFRDLSPEDVYWDYHKAKKAAGDDDDLLKVAGDNFVDSYQERLNNLGASYIKHARETGKSIQDLIGLEEGDTLLSWERGGHRTFRTHTAAFLREMGYDVEER